MCLYPTIIKNRKYTITKKNGGNVPPLPDERVKYVPVGCQQCIECRKQKARGWQLRLLEDIKTNTNGIFITLTFSNESICKLTEYIAEKNEGIIPDGYELDNEIATTAMRLFLERWRKKHGRSLRHWMVTELGHTGTENIHLHGIIWTDNRTDIAKLWSYGYIWDGNTTQKGKRINYVNDSTVNYITKYVTKVDEHHKHYKSKILTSPGIGRNYTVTSDFKKNSYAGQSTIETYRTRTGHKMAMPTYWRNWAYSEKEREQLWLQRLDKNERWVCGERTSIAKNENEYWKLVEYHRKVNKQLGYGTGEKNWEQEQYERARRTLMQEKRMADARKKQIQSAYAAGAH